MANAHREANRSFPRGCLFGILSLCLGIGLTAGTVFYQRQDYPVCQGALSAGFPLVFICDDTGGSPISSWGKVDATDWFNMNPRAFLLDFLLLSALLWLAWLAVISFLRKDRAFEGQFRWAVVACIGYILLFLVAFLSFQSSPWNFRAPIPRTPTPVIYTPTPFVTPPPLPWTSFPTLRP